jgi:hypothetical protein
VNPDRTGKTIGRYTWCAPLLGPQHLDAHERVRVMLRYLCYSRHPGAHRPMKMVTKQLLANSLLVSLVSFLFLFSPKIPVSEQESNYVVDTIWALC